MLAYGTPLMPTAIAYWVFTSSDRFLLEKLSTRAELGLYSVAVVGVSALQFVNAAVGQAWSPHAVKLYEEQPEQAPVMYGRVLTYLLGLFACLAVGLASFAREALMMLSTPPYIPAAAAVGPLALSIIASASSQVTAAGISLKKRTSFLLLYSWAAALLNVGFNILLIPQWGMLGASWATAASYIFLTLSCLYTSQRLWPIVIETRRTVSIVVSTVLFITALGFMPELPLLPSLGLKAGFCLSFGLVLFAVGAFHWAELRSTFFLFKARTGQNRV
jgi:O-antigen/teichoic acid export membrane protein